MADVANLVVALKLEDGLSAGLGRVSSQLNSFNRPLSQMGRGVGQVASGLDRLATRAAVAAAGGLTAVVTTAASFEQAFTGVEKTVDGTEAQLGRLEEQFREMARTIPLSFEELAGIGEAGGALGIARDDLLEFTDVVARLAVSTDLSSDQAATALGQLGNVLHLSGQDFEDFADSLVALGNAGASTESQIVEIAARFGAAGNSAGLSKEEILALSSAVASMGIEVEAGGSALSRIFNNVATNIGTSSGKAKAFAKTLGLSAGEFRKAWEQDALGTFEDFLAKLNELDQFEAASILKKVGITNTRDVATVRLMAQNTEFLSEQLEISAKAQGALRTESDKFFGTAQSQWKTFINVVRDGAAIIGDEVLPVTKDILGDLSKQLNDPTTRSRLKAFGKDLAEGIGTLVRELKGADFSGLIGGMKLAADVAKGAFDAFRSLPQPIQQLAIAALVANKVSGGAVGQIAKGLGNILAGGLKLAIPKLGLFERGSPTNPMFVSVVGPGGLGGTPIVGGAAGKGGGLLRGALRFIPVVIAAQIASEIQDEVTGAGVDIGDFLFGKDRPRLDPGDLQWPFGPKNPPGPAWLQDILGDVSRPPSPQSSTPIGQFDPANRGGVPAPDFGGEIDDIPRVREEIRALRDDNRAYDGANQRRFGSLEQRLIGDDTFAQGLTPERFLKLLSRTSEFGEKGVGTSIEFGKKTGKDPFGEAMLALARRIPEEHLKDRRVIGELERHIVAAEEVQAALIEKGDIEGAKKLQTTIDGLHALLGTQDRTNALAREQKRVQEETARRISDTRAAIHEQRQAFVTRLDTSNTRLAAIEGKNFSPTVNVGVDVFSTISVSEVVRASIHTRTASGVRGGNIEGP